MAGKSFQCFRMKGLGLSLSSVLRVRAHGITQPLGKSTAISAQAAQSMKYFPALLQPGRICTCSAPQQTSMDHPAAEHSSELL